MSGQAAAWFTAIGTVGAVIVALFSEYWRPWLHGPKLELLLRETKGEPVLATLTPPASDPNEPRDERTRWYHVLVINNRSRTPATHVQVYLSELHELDVESGEFVSRWVGDIPLQWRYQESRLPMQTIGENIADCDLCHVVRDKWLELNPLVRPVGMKLRWRVPECPIQLILTLQARGIEAVSDIVKFRISWNGEWEQEDSEMWNHLTVKRLKS